MKNLRIIEDQSPYFITFTFDGIEEIIDIGKNLIDTMSIDNVRFVKLDEHFNATVNSNPTDLKDNHATFTNIIKWPEGAVDGVVNALPWDFPEWKIAEWEFTLLHSGPDYFHCIHKDRAATGINFFILVEDDKCVTHYYDEEEVLAKCDHEFAGRFYASTDNDNPIKYEPLGGKVRRAFGVHPDNLTPIKTFIGKQSQGMFINTDLWHTWHNKSEKNRAAMSIRPKVPALSRMSFEEMRLKLFGF